VNSYQRINRAFKQAPWRWQMQVAASGAAALTIALLLGLLFLTQASRAATTGRKVQELEQQKLTLARENAELRARLAGLRSFYRMRDRAAALGFFPAMPDQVEYLVVDGYAGQQAVNMVVEPPTTAQSVRTTPEAPVDFQQTLGQWLVSKLFGIEAEASEGGAK
jgi:hypothetical protein